MVSFVVVIKWHSLACVGRNTDVFLEIIMHATRALFGYDSAIEICAGCLFDDMK